jgi:uncharacterized protein (DUF3820 family)
LGTASCFLFTPINTATPEELDSATRSPGESLARAVELVRGDGVGGSMVLSSSQSSGAERNIGRIEEKTALVQTDVTISGSAGLEVRPYFHLMGTLWLNGVFIEVEAITQPALETTTVLSLTDASEDSESFTDDESVGFSTPSKSNTQEKQLRGPGPTHDYWRRGDQAGGFLVDFGQFKGRPVRDLPWEYLLYVIAKFKDWPVSLIFSNAWRSTDEIGQRSGLQHLSLPLRGSSLAVKRMCESTGGTLRFLMGYGITSGYCATAR